MGYRTYLAKISKVEYAKIKDISFEDFKRDDDFSALDEVEEIFSLGDCGNISTSILKPFFMDKELHDYMNNDICLCIGGKDLLKALIEEFKKLALSYYKRHLPKLASLNEKLNNGEPETITNDELNSLMFLRIGLFDTRRDVEKLATDIDADYMTKSSLFEFAIFELLYIYKNFDWKNDILVFRGG